jgi:hypothetical protein
LAARAWDAARKVYGALVLKSEKAAKAVEKEDATCGESPSLRLPNEPSRAAAEDSDGDWQEEESFDEEQTEYDADAIRRSLRLSDESVASLAADEDSDGDSMPRLSPEVSDDDGPPPRRPGKLAPPRAAPEGSDDDDGPPPLQLDSDSDDSVVITYKA